MLRGKKMGFMLSHNNNIVSRHEQKCALHNLPQDVKKYRCFGTLKQLKHRKKQNNQLISSMQMFMIECCRESNQLY